MFRERGIALRNKFELWKAKIYGKYYPMIINDHIQYDAYYYKGRFYVVEEKRIVPEWKPRRTRERLSKQLELSLKKAH